MNVINNPSQTDTKRGEVTYPAVAALISAGVLPFENALLKVVTNSGVAQFSLPTGKADHAYYIASQFDIPSGLVSGEIPSTNENARYKAYGTGNAGDLIILADPTANSGAQAGMVRSTTGSHAPVSSDGTFTIIGIAEEIFIDGQDVKVRFLGGLQTVTF